MDMKDESSKDQKLSEKGLDSSRIKEDPDQVEDGVDFEKKSSSKCKESKAGIIYLSTIPPGMNIKQIRDYFAQIGEVNRSFLQPERKGWKAKGKRKNLTFTEGWIEFRKRRHAKKAAATFNNNPVGGKKSKVYHDFLWNIKYLPGFQWVHLNERLAYERVSLKQRLRAEISAVKRETNFFAKSIDLSKKLKKKGIIGKAQKSGPEGKDESGPDKEIEQLSNDSSTPATSTPEQMNNFKKQSTSNPDRSAFFLSLFGSQKGHN